MNRASISETKNHLSALLERARQGQTIIIEDRGVPIARLEPIASVTEDDDGRLARLERQGLIRRGGGRLPRSFFETPLPRPRDGRQASDIIIEERPEGW